MRRLGLIAAMLISSGAAMSSVQPSPSRQAELLHLLRQDCGSCHGLTLRGGLGPPLLPENLASRPDDYLVDAIIQGVPGTPMPPWGFEISRDEATWLVHRMRRGLDGHG